MNYSEEVILEGHIIDSLTLSKVLDLILLNEGAYEIVHFSMGATRSHSSKATIRVSASSPGQLEAILHLINQHGALLSIENVTLQAAPADGVLPDSFYSTTNLDCSIRYDGSWITVRPTEMDCAIVLSHLSDELSANTVPIHKICAGDLIVVGDRGIRVTPMPRRNPGDAFSFMGSDVSSERSKELVIAGVAASMNKAKNAGRKILFVGGPAIVHTGAGKYLEALILSSWVDVLFAGNALATHDIESALYKTSLGVELATGSPVSHGHEHHLRAINTIRSAGSIKNAVETGILSSGIMHACTKMNINYVLAGSIRDDGPLPDVITDSVQAQDKMRSLVVNAGVVIMIATTLHSVATGNLLPANVTTICVDNDADTVIKLMDRGSHQAYGVVTDCEFFMKELCSQLEKYQAKTENITP